MTERCLWSQSTCQRSKTNIRPLGQIDADGQPRAPRAGFRGPIARPTASVFADQRLGEPRQSCSTEAARARFSGTLAQCRGGFW